MTAVDPDAHALYDGASGEATTVQAFVDAASGADLVAIGELHHHRIGSRIELEVLQGLAGQDRRLALAMEFFERDHQPALDQYLAGEMEESEFRALTHRDDNYETSHRPLIEFCKVNGIPVIAANAPRRLVTGFRKSGLDYASYLDTLSDEDRRLLPRQMVEPDDAFRARFIETMGPKRGPAFLGSMVLWNDAMAESMADFRAEHPEHRILFIVGGFHVAAGLGTATSYKTLRPNDRIQILLMQAHASDIAFQKADRGEADAILRVIVR